jgi:hypothetical protein
MGAVEIVILMIVLAQPKIVALNMSVLVGIGISVVVVGTVDLIIGRCAC